MSGFECDAQFKCPRCRAEVETTVQLPEPNWTAERFSDLTADDPVEIACPLCEEVFEGYAWVGPDSCNITLNGHPETLVHAGSPHFGQEDDWSTYETPEDPYSIFLDSLRQSDEMLVEHGDGTHLVNRMVFAHRIGALEAYLADTIINIIEVDADVFSRLLASSTDLAKEKFTLSEIQADPNFVKSKIRAYLRSLTWHNLPKASRIYSLVLDLDLLNALGDENKILVMKAVEHRHDCVHRNGYDKDGKRLDVFTKEYVLQVSKALEGLVGKIEAARLELVAVRFFTPNES